MNAVAITDFPQIGKVVEQLDMVSVDVPKPKRGEVAIKLMASSMHPDEIYAAQGTALGMFFGPKIVSDEQPYLMGSSVSGVVVALGDSVDTFSVGDAVIVVPHHMGDLASWATYRCVAADMVRMKTVELSHVEAAAATMASCVAWGAVECANVKDGDRCILVGASGAIGIMVLQFLKTLNVHVTAVCSQRNEALVRKHGADAVVDYTKTNFADNALEDGIQYDAIFDCVGGRQVEQDAFRSLALTGRFVTVVGPRQYVGETKLSWPEVAGIISHVLWRSIVTRFHGPRYIFSDKLPRNTIDQAMALVVKNDIRMPIDREISFQLLPIKEAIEHLMTHRARGRIVINFEL